MIGVAVALLFPGIPILAFIVSYRHPAWDFSTWVEILIPNVLLVLLVAVLVAGIYLAVTRPQSPR